MKVFIAGVVIYFALASSVSAGGLPANPWTTSNNTVKINKTDSKQRKNQDDAYQLQAQMIAEMERQNEIIRQRQAARRKAEAEASQRAAAAQNSDSEGSFFEKISAFLADDDSQNSAKPRPVPTNDSDMFDMEWLQGYDDLKRNTEQSFNKVKRNFDALTNIDIEKTIDDTLKSLQ